MRHPTRRAVTAALLAAPALAACSSGSSDASGAGPSRSAPGPDALASAGPQSVVLWHGLGGAAGAALTAVLDAWNAAPGTPGVTVQAVYQGNYDDVLAKYTAALRDGSTPHVLLSSDITTGFVKDAGQTVSASALATANPGDLDLGALRPAAKNYYTVGGDLLSVPFNTSLPLLYANDALLSRAGVDPASLTTVAGLDAAARAVAAKVPGVKGFCHPTADGWWFEQVTAAAGDLYVTPDNGRSGTGATALSLGGSAQREALELLTKLHVDGTALVVGTNGDAAIQAFASGQVALMFNSSGAIGSLAKTGATGWSTHPLPLSGPAGTSGPLIGGASLWVDGKHEPAAQVAAWKVVSHLASAAVQERFSQASGYAPVNVGVDDSPTQREFLAKNPAWAVAVEQFDSAATSPATAGALTGALPGIRSVVVPAMDKAYGGDETLDAALDEAAQAAGTVISDYREQAGL
ncbi:extracellular solute-binding protein [Kineococcus endophyticus]|uniref:Extracellular solute-binding protein n=1 Tax=Kineococcus endophyticus TaxID=1181883 RepID=A0ABV3P0Y5_9ACTN